MNDINCFLSLAVLPVMLSSKLLPEMEMDDNSKREQLLLGMQNLPVSVQIEKLKVTHLLTMPFQSVSVLLYTPYVLFFLLS